MADINYDKLLIASRIAKELNDGDVVNLGIGLPTMVANNIPDDIEIILQSENGIMGMGPAAEKGLKDYDIINAGAECVTIKSGGMFFDAATSFGIIRGGHVDVTVLGALQVDSFGNVASWIIPGKMVPGMGGAMDLVVGAKKVIIGMLHMQNNTYKILKKCTLPLTAVNVVDLIVTEMGVIEVPEDGLVLIEYNPEYTIDEIKKASEADILVSGDIKYMI